MNERLLAIGGTIHPPLARRSWWGGALRWIRARLWN
jgi:hypothetical protein